MSAITERYYSSDQETIEATRSKPLTYVEWLQYETSFDRVSAFEQYTQYLAQWYNKKTIEHQSTDTQYIKNIYTELLKQITLEYTTPDEKRFLSNIDFENENDLDIALPFFAKKLKQIAIYYANQREEVKFSSIKANLKGSEYGINQVVYKHVADIIKYDPDVVTQLADMNLTQQDVLTNLRVEIQELYDTEQNYYNIPEKSARENYTDIGSSRYNYFNISIVPDRAKMFLSETFTDTIKDLIREVPVLMFSGIESITENDSKELRDIENRSYAITDIVTGTELDRLDDSNFENYLSTGNLNITNEQLLFKKYCGTDYYYLSTGDTVDDITTGQLFSADNPHRNILNKFYPTLIPIPGENMYKQEYIGGFFTSTGVGILTYTTLDFEFDYKPKSAETLYYFPDPRVGASGFFGADRAFDTVIEYYENINWQKCNITTHYNFGLQLQYKNIARFTPYQSKSDTTGSFTGVSRADDKFDFWSSNGENIWANNDVYPLKLQGEQPTIDRYNELLGGEQIIYKWKTDLYGNDYALIKKHIEPIKHTPINTNSTLYETEYMVYDDNLTTPVSNKTNLITNINHDKCTLTEQKSLSGKLYVRNPTYTGIHEITSDYVQPLYEKYNVPGTITYNNEQILLKEISNEIQTSIQDIDIIYDTILIETKNYIVFEKIMYDYETGIISSGHNNFSFVKKKIYNNKFEKISNWWYDKKENQILILKTTVHPELANTTDKMIYPEIYNYNMSTGKVKRTYPDPDLNDDQLIYETSQYSLSGINKFNIIDIDRVKSPRLTYNKDSERYTVSQLGYDIADNIFLIKNDFLMYDNTVQAVRPSIYKNNYVIYTVQPADESIQRTFFYETNPNLTYLTISEFTYVHDIDRSLLFMGCKDNLTTGNPDPRPNSSCVFIHGTEPQSMQAERDIVMCFEFMTCGFINGDTAAKPNGISVVFFQANVKDQNIKNAASAEPEYELLDTGGLGPAFSYLDDSGTGTNTTDSLTGLDSGHACVILDPVGNVGGDTTKQPNNITVFGQFDSTNRFHETVNLDNIEHTLWTDISNYNDYTDLPFLRCKVVLTDLGKRIKVYMKPADSEEHYKLVANVSLTPASGASKVFYDKKIFKCIVEHESSNLVNIQNDLRVVHNGNIYRCLRDHTSIATETPANTPFYWKIDNDWPYKESLPEWAGSTGYTSSNWVLSQTYAELTDEFNQWAADTTYYSDYETPGKLKVALTSNTSVENPGLTVIKNITVTGASNNL